PSRPNDEKQSIYECGEESIGSAWIQFDSRYYVVALLFVIFDVEVIFFFPWAEVFGKANAVANFPRPQTAADYRAYAARVNDLATPYRQGLNDRTDGLVEHFAQMAELDDETLARMHQQQQAVAQKIRQGEPLTPEDLAVWRYEGYLLRGITDLQLEKSRLQTGEIAPRTEFDTIRETSHNLALTGLVELAVFFGVLLVGFAYLWRRGDLEWVRAVQPPPPAPVTPPANTLGGQDELAR
ncbi:MAG: NADH-quinone oxidoreductase subunit A, partial [Gemmataceae bacterium]